MSTPQSDGKSRQKGHLTPRVSDKRLIPRIKEYLATVIGHRKGFVSAEDIAYALQEQYHDYARKKKRPFLQQVEEVYNWLSSKRESEEKISGLEDKHLARRQQSQIKQNDHIKADESDGDTSSSFSFGSDIDFELTVDDIPTKAANLLNTTLQSVYQSKGTPPTAPHSTNGHTSLEQLSGERNESRPLLPESVGVANSSHLTPRSADTTGPLQGHKPSILLLGEEAIPFKLPACGDRESVLDRMDESESPLPCTPQDRQTALHWRTQLIGTPPNQSNADIEALPNLGENRTTNRSDLVFRESEDKSVDGTVRKRKNSEKSSTVSESRQKRKKVKDLARETVGDLSVKTSSKKAVDPDFVPIKSTIRFSDIGGSEDTLKEVCKLLLHLRHPEIYRQLGISPPHGFLLVGPPGCGKSLVANAVAGELDLPYFRMAATEVVSGISGESEEKLRKLFRVAKDYAPCVVFLDEIDAISPKRETAQREMERRIVAQLLSCMDELDSGVDAGILVIGATNRPDSLDPALRRAGRFDREVWLGIPNLQAREKILSVLCRGLRLSGDVTYRMLAELCPGFVGADLMALTREAAIHAVERTIAHVAHCGDGDTVCESTPSCDGTQNVNHDLLSRVHDSAFVPISAGYDEFLKVLHNANTLSPEKLNSLSISFDDFKSALMHVQPSAKREGFATVPDVTWDDIGALDDVREELKMSILAPVQFSEQFEALGLSDPPGILLAGPPGCGKTLLAKAIANESRINFLSVKGPELLNMYVGESERAVRQVFQRARNSAPCVIFFDELDALCPKRSEKADSSVSGRVVNQLLTEMDGVSTRKQVFIMAATNRPDIIDPAVLRPGRIDKVLYVGLPDEEGRAAILKTLTKNGSKPLLSEDVKFNELACDKRSEMYTGADLSALVREAAITALKELIEAKNETPMEQLGASDEGQAVETASCRVYRRHFDTAFGKIIPSVSEKDLLFYSQMARKYSPRTAEHISVTNSIITHFNCDF